MVALAIWRPLPLVFLSLPSYKVGRTMKQSLLLSSLVVLSLALVIDRASAWTLPHSLTTTRARQHRRETEAVDSMTNMTTPPTNDDEDDAGDDESLMELKTGRVEQDGGAE